MLNQSETLMPLLPEQYRSLTRPAVQADALSLGPRLRRADKEELLASSGQDGTAALIKSLGKSALAWTFLHPETHEPHTMAGLGLLDPAVGVPWLLSADLNKPARCFFRAVFNPVLDYMHRQRKILVNMVDARNKVALKWLRFAGFELRGPFVWGVEQRPFYQLMSWRNKDV
jgi:hypothetical protein